MSLKLAISIIIIVIIVLIIKHIITNEDYHDMSLLKRLIYILICSNICLFFKFKRLSHKKNNL